MKTHSLPPYTVNLIGTYGISAGTDLYFPVAHEEQAMSA
jgi:hypothetical protein